MMHTSTSGLGATCAPLLGHNLVRLLYLDEAGTDAGAPHMCVAGVLVHGDNQYSEIDRRIKALIQKHIPAADRPNFVFHATDIFHGSRYFDRRKPEWADRAKRNLILNDLTDILRDLMLPVVCGSYEKDKFTIANVTLDRPLKDELMHSLAILDCIVWADRWLAKYSPSELATVVHEDGVQAKARVKYSVRLLRSGELLDATELGSIKEEIGLPLKRIIDTVHFTEKLGAPPLQLADLCAFVIGRAIKGLTIPSYPAETILALLKWRSALDGASAKTAPFSEKIG